MLLLNSQSDCANTKNNTILVHMPSYLKADKLISHRLKRGDYPTALRNLKHICGCHNFFPLSSVQIIIVCALG